MSIKIYLPEHLFYTRKDLHIYGEVKINDLRGGISYYVVGAIEEPASKSEVAIVDFCHSQLRLIGEFTADSHDNKCHIKDVPLRFAYTQHSPNVYVVKLNVQYEDKNYVNVILYSEKALLQLQDLKAEVANEVENNEINSNDDDMKLLYQLLKQKQLFILQYSYKEPIYLHFCLFVNHFKAIIGAQFREICNALYPLRFLQRPFRFLAQHSTLYEHYQEWNKFKASKKRNYNIVLDKLLGLVVMLLLLMVLNRPAEYLISVSHFIVLNLRNLLNSLRGSPIGLKLNGQLNNFLLNCFGYHVDLWSKFLDLIEPMVGKLFMAAALFGIMGFSFQLAVLADLIGLVSLHAHCFSIYTAVLYKVEINGLSALWKMMLGKRWNILKKRVESHDYNNRQLYLGTMFFTTLLFLFPTILTYYVVFTTVRLCIALSTFILNFIRRNLLEFPLEILLNWCSGNFYDRSALLVQQIPFVKGPPEDAEMPVRMFVFRLQAACASLGNIFKYGNDSMMDELRTKENSSFRAIFHKILTGKL